VSIQLNIVLRIQRNFYESVLLHRSFQLCVVTVTVYITHSSLTSDTTRTPCRACRARRASVSSRVYPNMADDEEAVVLASTSLVFCALDLHQSLEELPEKVRWTCPPQSTLWRRPWTRVVRVALVVTSVSRCALRQARHSASRPATTFPYARMHGLHSVSCLDVTSQVEFGLYRVSYSKSICLPVVTSVV